MSIVVLSSILIFAATAAVVVAASALGSRVIDRRLAELGASPLDAAPNPRRGQRGGDSALVDANRGWMERALSPLAQGAARFGKETVGRLRQRLTWAGYRGESALTYYLGGRVAFALAFPVIVWFSPLRTLAPLDLEFMVPLLAFAVAYVGPSYWLDFRTRVRQDEIDKNLPSALDLMVVCIEAGLGLVQALSRVGEELRRSSPVLAQEFALVSLETRAGKSNTEALRGLAERTGVREVSILVAMLTQTERFGTSLADSLRVHCDTMRITRMQRAEESAAKAPLKMLFPTSLILFALVGLIIGLAGIRVLGALAT